MSFSKLSFWFSLIAILSLAASFLFNPLSFMWYVAIGLYIAGIVLSIVAIIKKESGWIKYFSFLSIFSVVILLFASLLLMAITIK
ncbi:hypothetical protein [Bacillus testis]|uniref:hypothetical protein n=1 Tax=Bacillus testis TaxID=1622072 RepID=UPI0011CB8FB2|nr:hypothetical protein [Bacillus testis]